MNAPRATGDFQGRRREGWARRGPAGVREPQALVVSARDGSGSRRPNRRLRRGAHDCGLSPRPARLPAQLLPVASRGCGEPAGERHGLGTASLSRAAPGPRRGCPSERNRNPSGPSPSRAGRPVAQRARAHPSARGRRGSQAAAAASPSVLSGRGPTREPSGEWAGAASTRWGRCPCSCL